jgi:hypothetical protein
MPSHLQISQTSVPGGDQPFTNFGAIDIPEDRGVVLDPARDNGILLPAAGGPVAGAIGITMDRVPAGATGRVRCLGTKRVFADGPISRGEDVQLSSTAGKEGFVRVAAAPGVGVVGRALMAAADGEPLAIWLFLSKNA